ncbi:MAG: hypothetical protein JNM27_14460 [Leptospirales bacterium]|nr:hypothetical protein [Leptospirales bacterium]
MPHVSISLQVYIVLAGVITAALLAAIVLRAGKRAGVSASASRIAILAGVYLLVTGLLAYLGALANFDSTPPRGALFFPVCIAGIVLLCRSDAFAKLLARIPMQTILEMQTFRFLAELLIFWLILEGAMPETMSFTGRNFDILVPLTAPLISFFLFRRPIVSQPVARLIGVVWNLAGMGILSVTVFTGIFSLPMPGRLFFDGISTAIIFSFPFHILPTYWVPLAFSLHVFSLLKLWRERSLSEANGAKNTTSQPSAAY